MAPQAGDIGVVPGSGFVMWLVRHVTRSPVGHAFLFAGSGRVIEGQPSGVQYNSLAAYPKVRWLGNLSAGLTDVQRAAIITYGRQHLGVPYSWIDDAEIGFTDLFGWAPRWMRSRLRSDATLMCSQLCDQAYAAAGVEIFTDGRPPGAVSPGDLWRANLRASTR
jgi:uncharacterized protein YycO